MRALVAATLLSVLILAGCSGKGGNEGTGDGGAGGASASVSGGPSGSAGTGPGGAANGTGGAGGAKETSISVSAVGTYPANPSFDPSSLSVPAGALVHVTFTNQDRLPVVQHNWVVEGIEGASSDTVGSGAQSAFDFTAPAGPGEFTFYCSIGDHRDRGMEGTLTVSA
ncbi:MAG TPA: cupredoxin domain-containing protein [Candidatus Thermoplasmatota archaeon]|nr:cupredoxin domain-containing protein [Candidatus Thermoplasmatota archaeon]